MWVIHCITEWSLLGNEQFNTVNPYEFKTLRGRTEMMTLFGTNPSGLWETKALLFTSLFTILYQLMGDDNTSNNTKQGIEKTNSEQLQPLIFSIYIYQGAISNWVQ